MAFVVEEARVVVAVVELDADDNGQDWKLDENWRRVAPVVAVVPLDYDDDVVVVDVGVDEKEVAA